MAQTGRSAEIADRVLRIARMIRRASADELAPLRLTPAQGRALRVIAMAPAPLRMGELAASLGVVPRSATELVDRLEDAELVRRVVNRDNRRSVLVSLTDRGVDIQKDMTRARSAAAERLFGTLRPVEREELIALLDRVVAGS